MIRFYNGKVLKMDGSLDITNEEVWVKGSEICYVGSTPDELPEFEREIDLKGDLLMPGFKNAHTHSGMTFLRSYADDLPLNEWLFNKVFPLEDKLTPDYIYWLTKLAIMEYLTSGITASFDMYFFRRMYAKANIECGFRTVICPGINDFTADMQDVEDEYLELKNYHPLISYKLACHAEYTTKLDRLKEIRDLLHKYKEPFFVHNSETLSEVQGCIERHGKTPTELFEDLGMYEYGGGGFHCVYMSDNDLDIFKKHGLWAVTNPGSNCKLASGIAPITKYLDKGINIAIGTDGPASNNALDMFREMYLVSVLQKILNNDAASCDAGKVLEMATVGGARAMGLDNCDSIAVGKQADLIIIDLSRPNMHPLNNITKNIVYSGSKENVRMTMVAGKVLYEKGEFFIGVEPHIVYENSNRIVREIVEG
ncbi:MAG: amidohydrolase [Ruminococcaceae bacterium]|nr:amidohydrolase [Oscillospiraceae bacterium]